MKYILALMIVGIVSLSSHAQPTRKFQDEVNQLTTDNQSIDKNNLILFTGSSTIRMWKSIKTDLGPFNILNVGFGGSQTTDLLFYADQLITQYKPKQIFIYEGDNDLGAGKTPEQIIATNDSLLQKLRNSGIKAQVFFISPKPSIARWNLKMKYEQYNQLLKVWTARQKNVSFIDVFTPMLDAQGQVRKDIFLEDGLHMNEKGYAIWTTIIKKYLR